MKYRLVIFDFDGTLANSMEWFLKTINDLAGEFHFKKIDKTNHKFLRHCSSQEVIKHLGLPIWKLPRLKSRIRRKVSEESDTITLFDGVGTMLRNLTASGLATAIVSSNSEDNIRTILGAHNAGRIQHYACGASLTGKAAKLKTVLRRTNIPAPDAIYIGDEIRDAAACRKVPMAFGAVAWGYTDLEALKVEEPDLVFHSVEEIMVKLI